MKKLFILTLLVFSTAVSVFATNFTNLINKENLFLKPGVTLHYTLTSPKSGCERFPGMCLVSFSISGKPSGYSSNEAYGSGYYENGILYLTIQKNQMGIGAKSGFNSLTILPIDADLTIDNETSTALGSSRPVTILQGNYPIRDNGTSYLIAINCR